MSWDVVYTEDAKKDLAALDGSQAKLARKAIHKVSGNPLPVSEGGYGKPLGSHAGNNLTGLFKIKLRGAGLRIVYKLVRIEKQMVIVVIGVREDDEVYELAQTRTK